MEVYNIQDTLKTITGYPVNDIITTGYNTGQPYYMEHFRMLKQVLQAAEENDLRVILGTGGSFIDEISGEYMEYLEHLTEYFKENNTLIAYQLFAEMIYSCKQNYSKTYIRDLTQEWYNTVKSHCSQLVTFGLWRTFETVQWDPELLACDFVNYHLYPINQDVNYVKRELQWIGQSITVPWIMGETGYHTPDSTWFDAQKMYVDSSMRWTVACGGIGYTYWNYHDCMKGTTLEHLGIYYHNPNPNTTGDTAHDRLPKHITDEFANFNPVGNYACPSVPDSFYYDPFNFCITNGVCNWEVEGIIKDINGSPIKNAVIRGEKIISSNYTAYFYTFSDDTGYFRLYTNYWWGTTDYELAKFYVSAPGMNLYTELSMKGISGFKNITLDSLSPPDIITSITLNNTTIYAGENIIWDYRSNIFPSSDIIVSGTLTIHSKVYMQANKEIIVERGGKLIIDGGTITNACGNLWKGITVEGDWGIIVGGQSIDPGPGQIIMKNGARIEYAETGIFSDYNGVVSIENSQFLNCPIGVSLENYDETMLSWSTLPNLKPRAKIKTTTFSTDGDFISTPLYDVKLWGSDMAMVTLEGDIFENTTTEAQLSEMNRGYGIFANNSDINISEYCPFISLPPCPNPVKSEFNGLTYGIYSQSPLTNTARIENCNFNNYYFRGVLLDNITAPVIRSNHFSNNLNYWTAGLYLWNSTAYHVENNTFNCQNTNNAVINNSGIGANELYRNHFNTASALHCYYTNSNTAGDQGLFIHCNNFHATDMDIFVKDGDIKKQQGYKDLTDNSLSISAANQFEQTYLNGDNAFRCENTGYSYFDYTYWFNIPGDVTDITGYTSSNVYPQPIGTPFTTNTCPSSIPYIGPVDAIAALTAADDQIYLMTSNLNDLVDGGNTPATLNKVASLAPNNFNKTCNELLNMSPYLSDTVLTTFMQTGVNGHVVAKTNVLYANSPLPPHARAELNNMWLPQPFKDYLLQYQQGTNAVVQKQEEIGAVRFDRNLTLNGVIRYGLQNDSIHGTKDSLITILENETDYTAKYTLIPLLINMKRYDDAVGQIADLQSLAAGLPTREQQYAMDYADLQTIALQLDSMHATDSVSMAPVVAPNEPLLSSVANDPNHPASGMAQSILQQAGYKTFVSPLFLPQDNKSLQVSPQENNQHPAIDIDNCVEVYPNPASNELWVEYLMVNGNNPQTIDIYTIKGKKILSISIKTAYGMVQIDVSSLQSGNYIVKVGNYSKQIAIVK